MDILCPRRRGSGCIHADLGVGGERLRARPLGEFRDGDREPLAGLQKPFEVGVEVGVVRGVGAEVLGSEASVAERAGAPSALTLCCSVQ